MCFRLDNLGLNNMWRIGWWWSVRRKLLRVLGLWHLVEDARFRLSYARLGRSWGRLTRRLFWLIRLIRLIDLLVLGFIGSVIQIGRTKLNRQALAYPGIVAFLLEQRD